MILDQQVETDMLTALRALVEEYGPEYVIVHIPKTWYIGEKTLGAVRLEKSTVDTVDILVRYQSAMIHLIFPLIEV